MWESDACADRMLSFVGFRYHLLFFCRPVTPQRHGTDDNGEPDPPMLQQARMAQQRMDAIGRSISEELRMLFLAYRPRMTVFEYVVHPMFIQNPFAFVPVTYLSPVIPHVTVYASVCKVWKESIVRVVGNRNLINFRRLLGASYQRHLVCHWIHGSTEDKFRFHADLLPEVRLLVVCDPLR